MLAFIAIIFAASQRHAYAAATAATLDASELC